MANLAKSGVSLAVLRDLAGRQQNGSTLGLWESVIRPATLSQACAYVDILPESQRGSPNIVVVHAWSGSFSALVDMLVQARPDADETSTFVWIDILACNLNDSENDERLDAVSHAATAFADSASLISRAETEAASMNGPPSAALEPYREAIRSIAAPTGPGGAPAGILAVALDPSGAVLTSPWCLYGIWQFLHSQRAAPAASILSSILPVCAVGLDAMLVHLVWENLSMLLSSPHASDTLHALLLEDVAVEESIPIPTGTSTASPVSGAAAGAAAAGAGASKAGKDVPAGTATPVAASVATDATDSGAVAGGAAGDQEPDIEARVASADAAIKHFLLASLEHRLNALSAAAETAATGAPADGELPTKSAKPAADCVASVKPKAEAAAASPEPEAAGHKAAAPEPKGKACDGDKAKTDVAGAKGAGAGAAKAAAAPAAATAAAPPAPEAPPAPVAKPPDAAAATALPPSPPPVRTSPASPSPSSLPMADPALLRALAAVGDAFGCLLWAAGRPEDGEPVLRRARELLSAPPGTPSQQGGQAMPTQSSPQPASPPRAAANAALTLLTSQAALHLGALLQSMPLGLKADEAELLLRSAIARLDAAHETDVVTSGFGGGGRPAGGVAPALLAAQARHFLARMLGLRAAAAAGARGAGTYPRNAAGLHHVRDASNPSSHLTSREESASAKKKAQAAAESPPAAAAAAVATQPAQAAGPASGPAGAAAAPPAPVCGAASLQFPQGAAPAEVAPLLRAALPAFEAHYGAEHPLSAIMLSNLAMALKDHGKLDEAEPLLRRALAAREACHGPTHVETMRCMNNLAGLLEAQGKLEEAETLLRRAAEVAASSLGPHHAYTANALSNLGVALRKRGKLDEAEELFKAALEIREKLLGPLALDTAASLSDMTALLLDQGKLTEAEPLFRRILDIRELVLGPGHKDTAASLCDLAALLGQLGRAVDAEPLLRRALSVQTRALGPGHEDTASATRELGKVLAQQGNAAEAEKLFRRALAILEAVLGHNHPETVITVNQLALLLKDSGQEADAEALFQRVLSLTESLESEDGSPSALQASRHRLRTAAMIAMRGLAEIAGAAGRLEEAEVLACKALVASERALGPVHPVTLSCAEGLAAVLQELGMLEDAAELYARLVETLAEEQGEEAPAVIKYLGMYEIVYNLRMERDQEAEREEERQRAAEEDEEEEDRDEDGAEGDADDEGQGHGRGRGKAAGAGGAPRASGLVVRSSESVASMVSALMSPFGRSATAAKAAGGACRRRGSGASAAAASVASGGGGGDDEVALHHSFASFVSRRSHHARKRGTVTMDGTGGDSVAPSGPSQERFGSGGGTASRAQSIIERVHSSLVASGRISSVAGIKGGPKKSRLAARSDAGAGAGARASGDVPRGSGGAAAAATGTDTDGPDGPVSPGLPRMGREEDEAAGATRVSLDPASPSLPLVLAAACDSSTGGLRATPPKSARPHTVGNVYDGTGAGGAAAAAGRPASNRLVSGKTGGGRSSVEGGPEVRRSVTNSMISVRGGLSKKALLAQAEIDLDDDDDMDEVDGDGVRTSPAGLSAVRKGAAADRPISGQSQGHRDADEDGSDDGAVGCCGFGGRRKARG